MAVVVMVAMAVAIVVVGRNEGKRGGREGEKGERRGRKKRGTYLITCSFHL